METLSISLKKRVDTYFYLNSQLSTLSTNELRNVLKNNEVSRGWGINHLLNFSGKKIFVKRVPLTQIEFDCQFSTKNHFNLPTFYNYGVGSAGLGAFRELVTHIKTTNWVLNGEIENFPLMYHYRILSKSEMNKPVDKINHRKYVKYWNNNKNIDRYVLARKKASYEIILFLEYFSFTAQTWILKNTNKFEILTNDMKIVTSFLKKKGIVHFDLHLANVLTDGRNSYLTDFGLCLDQNFELSVSEKKFFKNHVNYDYDAFLCALGYSLFELFNQLSLSKKNKISKQLKFPDNSSPGDKLLIIFKKLNMIKKLEYLNVDSSFLDFLNKNKNKILKMRDFYIKLRDNSKKNIKYISA